MKTRIFYLTICGLVLAGIVHISIILLIPDYGSRDAWNIISSRSDMWVFHKLSAKEPSKIGLEDTDPYLKMGACTFDLGESGLHITGGKSKTFWSVSVFAQDGTVMYSLNNRSAIDHRLDLVVLNPVQMIGLREALPEEIERSVVVEADIGKGFVVLRQFQDDLSDAQKTEEFLGSAHCKRFENQ